MRDLGGKSNDYQVKMYCGPRTYEGEKEEARTSKAAMAIEPPYPRCFNLTLKGDPSKNFNIDINKRVADAPDMEQKVTEKVCRTFEINPRNVQSVFFYENRLNRLFTLGAKNTTQLSAKYHKN